MVGEVSGSNGKYREVKRTKGRGREGK